MKAIANFDAVCEAAFTLMRNGQEPTTLSVQKQIGGGSYSTVKKHLEIWTEQRKQNAKTMSEIPSEILEQAQELGRSIWSAAVTEAKRDTLKIKENAEIEVKAALADLSEATAEIARLEAVENELATALDQNLAKYRETELSLVAAQTIAAQVPKLEIELAEARAAVMSAHTEITNKASEIGKLLGELDTLRIYVRELMQTLKEQRD